ncbi:hypothetical protein [Streptobacillus moniliformis]|uniref:Uncharacterized protein n=1 Tax=Streptobacillus moniliformis (strain ATCC 14647 / DSM 12112 / NCTC 10651 / 9901) TaxID=519441 RepID=D1AYI8_STRM9|nr:hypothetical protein [Streptobacillus moniliformis]ACZ01364.1 hypothetical protein Smon_0897 [Streptobacillus moniliformis DSM 12112]SQA13478.1 Uncharacterised protein [Streptobacillus moniliformis]
MEEYNNYLLWKRKNILKVISKEIQIFEYSVDKKYLEIKEFLQTEKSIDEIREYEKKSEKDEKEIFYRKENGIIIEFQNFLEGIVKEVEKEYEAIKNNLKDFVNSNNKYSDLNDENSIKQIIFEEKISNIDKENIIDIYEIEVSKKGKVFHIDYNKKEIRAL